MREYPTLEEIIANADKIGEEPKLIKENKDSGIFCKALASLKLDIGIEVVEDLKVEEYDYEELADFSRK